MSDIFKGEESLPIDGFLRVCEEIAIHPDIFSASRNKLQYTDGVIEANAYRNSAEDPDEVFQNTYLISFIDGRAAYYTNGNEGVLLRTYYNPQAMLQFVQITGGFNVFYSGIAAINLSGLQDHKEAPTIEDKLNALEAYLEATLCAETVDKMMEVKPQARRIEVLRSAFVFINHIFGTTSIINLVDSSLKSGKITDEQRRGLVLIKDMLLEARETYYSIS
jgi:hypothetical protein